MTVGDWRVPHLHYVFNDGCPARHVVSLLVWPVSPRWFTKWEHARLLWGEMEVKKWISAKINPCKIDVVLHPVTTVKNHHARINNKISFCCGLEKATECHEIWFVCILKLWYCNTLQHSPIPKYTPSYKTAIQNASKPNNKSPVWVNYAISTVIPTHRGEDGNSQMFPVQDIPALFLDFHMLNQFIQVLRCRSCSSHTNTHSAALIQQENTLSWTVKMFPNLYMTRKEKYPPFRLKM